ncbi:hypothetical protein [Burkholderia ambifaria]|uniref:hypothetical protein n=1 Tax=Burkholderia ambifaria TaxID=152480 RepID=UPI001FC8445F|nr:hypothetical protein [Burkholderia ambifaria]
MLLRLPILFSIRAGCCGLVGRRGRLLRLRRKRYKSSERHRYQPFNYFHFSLSFPDFSPLSQKNPKIIYPIQKIIIFRQIPSHMSQIYFSRPLLGATCRMMDSDIQ